MIKRLVVLGLLMSSWAVMAQQTGNIYGTVTDKAGSPLPGVTVQASAPSLPQARVTVTDGRGDYRLNRLPPGETTLVFTMTGMTTVKQAVILPLGATIRVDVVLQPATQEEALTVTGVAPLIDLTSAEREFNIRDEVFEKIPLGQDYRDLIRLAPGVQVTENLTRGPSAGGNGQDNVYKFDGVDVTLPLFGTLAAEPSNHDIEQVTLINGGAKAVNFNRSGGFLINSISKSGTNEYKGRVEYIYRDGSWTSDTDVPATSVVGETDRNWGSVDFGGPLVKDRLFFFASYFAPRRKTSTISNVYGQHPDGSYDKDEIFGKLTWSPISDLTLHGSFRSAEEEQDSTVGSLADVSLGSKSSSDLGLTVIEGDYTLNSTNTLNFNYTRMNLDTGSTPNGRTDFVPSRELGSTIDLSRLHEFGVVNVPSLGVSSERDALYQPYVDRYGFVQNGVRRGGGATGISTLFDNDDFARTAFQFSWEGFFSAGNLEHELHAGFRHTEDEEDLGRDQQGLGNITFLTTAARLIQAEFIQSQGSDPIHSEYHSDNIELNDTITTGPWSLNVGVLLSHDELFGQDLTEDSSTPSGYRISIGSRYRMYEIDWEDMIQPRIGLIRELRKNESVYANWAVYNPMASSLPRAASWARNRRNLIVRNTYSSDGVLVATENRGSTSGKFFQPDMDPREIQEYLIGYNRQLDSGWTYKFSARHRYGSHFWEDTNNDARTAFYVTAPEDQQDAIRARGLYIPDLDLYRNGDPGQNNGVGGSSYVIAELDGAFTKYYEATADVEKRGENYYVKGSYTWSHYYGNFDQDNTTVNNDQNIFIGSSNLGDGVGRQLWDFKYGNLKGDRRHLLKVFGSYDFAWKGTLGALAYWQSGEAWETSDSEYYRAYTTSTSSTNRFSEPAGSRTGPGHYQLDLNYRHHFAFSSMNLALFADVFNVFDKQTGYNIDGVKSSPNYGLGGNYILPRRYQIGVALDF